jgi:hypothetical protein
VGVQAKARAASRQSSGRGEDRIEVATIDRQRTRRGIRDGGVGCGLICTSCWPSARTYINTQYYIVRTVVSVYPSSHMVDTARPYLRAAPRTLSPCHPVMAWPGGISPLLGQIFSSPVMGYAVLSQTWIIGDRRVLMTGVELR